MKVLFIVYDDEAHLNTFPIGTAQLTAVLENVGYKVDLYLQDIYHYPESHLTEYLDKNQYDFIGLSFIGGYWQYRKAIAISRAVRASNNGAFYCLGGHGPSPDPEYFLHLTQADAVCIGEGDETILHLLEVIAEKRSLSEVKGIAWREGDVVYFNERRPLILDIDTLPFPAYHRFPMEIYRLLRLPRCLKADFVGIMLSGRGCPFKCNFCYRMDEGFRPRSNESIIEEIKLLKKDYSITYIAFYDDLLMSSVDRMTSLCEDFIRQKINVTWNCNGRLNYVHKDVIELMRKAGCVFINYGIESFDDTILRNMGKALTTRQIEKGIAITLDAGISPGLNIIFGNIGENAETLQKGVDFLLKYDDGAQLRTIRPVTPYPGCDLYYEAINRGILKDCADFYENKHTNSDLMAVNFTTLTDDEFYEALFKANKALLDNYRARSARQSEAQLQSLYVEKDATFRGFR